MEEKQLKLVDEVIQKLQTVIDPELYVDIVNLGLIYGIDLNDNNDCIVTMTLTVMGCPLSGVLDNAIKEAVLSIPEIKSCEIKLVWSPAWSVERMSDAAKTQLNVWSKDLSSYDSSNKKIDFSTPVKKYIDRYDDFLDLLLELGFDHFKIPNMIETVGRVMTLKQAAQAMKVSLLLTLFFVELTHKLITYYQLYHEKN